MTTMETTVLERGAALNFPPIDTGNGSVQGRAGWQAALRMGQGVNMARELDRLEQSAADKAERDARVADATERRGPEYDPELERQALEEAREGHEVYERDRPRRVEELLSRAVRALEELAGRR